MLSWILIALIIAFIFGIIKVETLKSAAEKIITTLKNAFNVFQNWSKTKIEEIKKAAENQKNNKN